MEAPASITCPDCRARWQRTHDDQGKYIEHTPVGYTLVYIGQATQPLTARSYAELRKIVQPLAEHTSFRVVLMAYMQPVGEGCYTRVTQGFDVLYEAGACDGLALAMMDASASTHI